MLRYKIVLSVGILILLTFPSTSAKAFHKDAYYPRVPEALLEILQDMDNPFSPTIKNIEEGSKVYFGKGLCEMSWCKWKRSRSSGSLST